MFVVAAIVVILFVFLAGKLFRSKYSPYAYVKELLYSTEPLQISTPLSLEETKRRLNDALTRFGIPYLMSNRLVGSIRNGHFKIQMHRRFISNSAAPVLSGSVYRSSDDGQTRIEGEYRMPLYMRSFMTFWFGFLGVWSVFGIPAGIIGVLAGRWESALFIVAPFLMFGFGVAFIKLGAGLSAKDRGEIADRIAEAIGGTILPK